ncbi:hypothetical protein B9Z38_10550 [Limnohabitans sp. MMS-10A-160]|nr:hypothetical protein B9Z38_10550 [Limnohabitans sp. MMS-10A-160]
MGHRERSAGGYPAFAWVQRVDCHVAALLAMTNDVSSRAQRGDPVLECAAAANHKAQILCADDFQSSQLGGYLPTS